MRFTKPADDIKLWEIGNVLTESAVDLITGTGLNPTGQCYFKAGTWSGGVYTPGTGWTGASSTPPIDSWFEIDTSDCDALAIVYGGKVASRTGGVTDSAIRAIAQGLVKYDPNIPAFSKPAGIRAAIGIADDSMQATRLSVFGSDGADAGEDASLSGDLAQHGLFDVGGANDYNSWQFYVGRRQAVLGSPVAASAIGGGGAPLLCGVRRVWVAIDSMLAGTLSAATGYGALYAVKFVVE